MNDFDTTVTEILEDFYGERYCGRCEDHHGPMDNYLEEAKAALYKTIDQYVIGRNIEYHDYSDGSYEAKLINKHLASQRAILKGEK